MEVLVESGAVGRSAVPSGVSTDKHEAVELCDIDKNRYMGKGVMEAIDYINNEIADEIIDFDATDQVVIDNFLIELILSAIEKTGYKPGDEITILLDQVQVKCTCLIKMFVGFSNPINLKEQQPKW